MEEKNPHISVVSPVYKAEKIIPELVRQLHENLSTITDDYEIILVNDASPDASWNVIEKLCKTDNKLKGIKLSRNFGQHNAITAGLDFAHGDWVVVMDCDLQDAPEDICRLYKHVVENNLDVVFVERVSRQDAFSKKMSSRLFYLVFNYFTDSSYSAKIANFSIISSPVVNAFRQLKEKNRDYTFFINWLGFKRDTIEAQHQKRFDGESSYSLRKLLKLAFDNIISNTNKPLYLCVKMGMLMAVVSFLVGLYFTLMWAFDAYPVEGWTSTVVSLWFICGLLMSVIGMTGIYIGKIFEETKDRPNYVVETKLNL